MTHDLHHQPCRISTRAEFELQRLFWRLYASFHAHNIVNVVLHALIDTDQHVNRAQFFTQQFRARICQPDSQ